MTCNFFVFYYWAHAICNLSSDLRWAISGFGQKQFWRNKNSTWSFDLFIFLMFFASSARNMYLTVTFQTNRRAIGLMKCIHFVRNQLNWAFPSLFKRWNAIRRKLYILWTFKTEALAMTFRMSPGRLNTRMGSITVDSICHFLVFVARTNGNGKESVIFSLF